MSIALFPLAAVAVYGYLQYHTQIAEPFREVLNTQHRLLLPIERVQGELWDISEAVNDFANDGNEAYRARFEATEREVATQLSALEALVSDHGRYRPILDGVEEQWSALLSAAGDVEAGEAALADPALHRFESAIAEVGKRLETMAEAIRLENEASHVAALSAMRQLEILATAAAIMSVLLIGAGIYIIDRALISSTDELVAGAMRIAAGDREREIDVQVPPELAAVANAFNVMTKQIIRQENELSAAARTDGLTGLSNRREFDRILAQQIEAAISENQVFALLLIDIDHFKRFNDSNGHLAGDDALRQIAASMKSAAREDDSTFRYGGEEFAMILPGLRAEAAFPAAERVRQTIADNGVFLSNGQQLSITVSIGVAIYGPLNTPPKIVGMADRALYAAKAAGRNAVKLAD
jgi:diguanylate cyclase (GGDEF)-like protein|tara:strand:+ start:40704 stop:41936 length:1233 start_codon:yes stop_codon:yes gene_type:complete